MSENEEGKFKNIGTIIWNLLSILLILGMYSVIYETADLIIFSVVLAIYMLIVFKFSISELSVMRYRLTVLKSLNRIESSINSKREETEILNEEDIIEVERSINKFEKKIQISNISIFIIMLIILFNIFANL